MIRKYGFRLGLLSILVLGGIYISLHKEDVFNTQKASATAAMTAENLISYVTTDKGQYLDTLVDQVIAVEGVIKEINYVNQRHTILLGGGQEDLALVICDMQTDQAKKTGFLKQGDTVVLKGVFKGFLQDAVFLNCVLTANQKRP